MADYQVYAWKLSDFSGDIRGDCLKICSSQGGLQKHASTRLGESAQVSSFFITDEGDYPVAGGHTHSLSLLTDKVKIDDLVFDAGQRIDIEFVLTTNETPASKFIVGHLSDPDLPDTGIRLVFSTRPIDPGQEFDFSDISDGPVGPDHTICFARGSMIDTPHGEMPVEELVTGDEVMTKDGGITLIEWVGKRSLTGFELALHTHLQPIRIKKDALGPNKPARDLVVSPQHRILIDDWRAEFYFGETEVLVPARSLLNGHDIIIDRLQTGVDYYHVLLENHELLAVNGQWAESLFPSFEALETLTPSQKAEIEFLKPGFFDCLAETYVSTRPTIRHEVAAAIAA